MLFKLLLLFTTVPILELIVLLKIGEQTEWWVPVAIVLATGLVGAWLARHQGLAVLREIRSELEQGRIPGSALLAGLFVLLGGALLVTPGVLTDIAGLCCLIPLTRRLMASTAKNWFHRQVEQGRFTVTHHRRPGDDDDWLPG